MTRRALPKSGWLAHAEQTQPDAGEFWFMKTTLPGGLEVRSIDTRTCPADIKAKLGARLPRYLTALLRNEKTLHFTPAIDAFTAEENHYAAVRAAIDGPQITQRLGQA